MRLNVDVIVAIMQMLQRKRDISALMRTCKILYSAGLPILIAEYAEDLSIQSASLYLDFLLAAKNGRIPLLRSLRLDVSTPFFDDAAQFLSAVEEVLCSSTQLVDLQLNLLHDEAPSRFPIVIGRCSSLIHLELHGITHSKAADLLSRMDTPLKNLKLNFSHPFQDEIEPFGLVRYLHKFGRSLETLSLLLIEWTIEDSLATQWVKMTSLETSYLPKKGSMSAVFPHLQNLFIHRSTHNDDAYGPPEIKWSHLDCVALSYPALMHLLPSCTIRQLQVFTQAAQPNVLGYERVLHHANPSALIMPLHIGTSNSDAIKYATRLWQAAPRLRCLVLNLTGIYSVKSHVCRYTPFPCSLLTNTRSQAMLLRSLSVARLKFLCLQFDDIRQRTFWDAPIVGATQAVVQLIPSLEYVFHTTTWGPAKYWRLDRSTGHPGAILVEIAKPEAERLQNLHMALADRSTE